MQSWEQIIPEVGDRAIITGQTGTGKSTLAKAIVQTMAAWQRTLIIDPKAEIDWFEGAEPVGSKVPSRVQIYRPGLDSDVVSETNDLLRQCYEQKDWLIYIDELYGIQEKGNYPAVLNAVYTRGRSRRVSVIACCQRPAWVPLFALTETQHQYVFRLPLSEDRGRMAAICGPKVLTLPPKFSFWYHTYNVDPDLLPTNPLRLEI